MTVRRLVQAACSAAARRCRAWGRAWDRFWFAPVDPAPLAAVRILTGVVLLYVHLTALPQLLDIVGPHGWFDAAAYESLTAGPVDEAPAAWPVTLWSAVRNPTAIVAVHALFLAAAACLTVGLFSRTTAVAVWLGQLSYVQRGFVVSYGLDAILAFLTLYLLIGPSGAAFSVDAWRTSRRGGAPPAVSRSASVALRCIQIHMCIVYLFAGLSKLQGASWWAGLATYYAAMSPEMWPVRYDVSWVGAHPWLVQALANLSVLFTLAFEISFAFLIWNPRLRPLLLGAACLLHLGIGLLLGLGSFGTAMLAGCLAFLPPETCRLLFGPAHGGIKFAWGRFASAVASRIPEHGSLGRRNGLGATVVNSAPSGRR